MFDFIRKPLVWDAWDSGLGDDIDNTPGFELKSIQDLAVYLHLRGGTGKRIAEIGAGHSRLLPTLARANECVAVEKSEGAGGGPREARILPSVENVPAYLGENDPALASGSFDIVFSISVVEHVGMADLEAFHRDQLRILKPGGMFVHAIDIYLWDEPPSGLDLDEASRRHLHNQVTRFNTYRSWVTSTEGVAPVGAVYQGPCQFTCDLVTNPDDVMYRWGALAPQGIGLRQAAQCTSLLVGGRKLDPLASQYGEMPAGGANG